LKYHGVVIYSVLLGAYVNPFSSAPHFQPGALWAKRGNSQRQGGGTCNRKWDNYNSCCLKASYKIGIKIYFSTDLGSKMHTTESKKKFLLL
jgi:hypothetical protein